MTEARNDSAALSVPSQLVRYGLVGLFSNLAGYCVYLLLTYLWPSPKLVMTALYTVGAVTAFFGNRRYTFNDDGHIGRTGVRYLIVHAFGYSLNFAILLV